MAVGLKPEIVAESPSESAKWSWATVHHRGDKWEGVEVRSENRKCWKNRQQWNRENERGVKLIGVGGMGECGGQQQKTLGKWNVYLANTGQKMGFLSIQQSHRKTEVGSGVNGESGVRERVSTGGRGDGQEVGRVIKGCKGKQRTRNGKERGTGVMQNGWGYSVTAVAVSVFHYSCSARVRFGFSFSSSGFKINSLSTSIWQKEDFFLIQK